MCSVDVKGVNFDFTGFAGLHSSWLLDLKYVFAFEGVYQGIEKERKNEVELSGQIRLCP